MAAWFTCLLLAAPEASASEMLKIAWASQYEWKEDQVGNATFGFAFTVKRKWGQGGETEYEGKGQVVVVGDAVVRRHYRGLAEDRRKEVDGHLDWVLGRFVRKPFEQEFQGIEITGPEEAPTERKKVTAGPRVFYLHKQRLDGVAVERFKDPRTNQPFLVRFDYGLQDVGGGYMVVSETYAYTYEGSKREQSRVLTLAASGETPAPATYAYRERQPGGIETDVALTFDAPVFDLPDPVTLSGEARDLLKQAWDRRVTLPDGLAISADFTRAADPRAGRWVTRRVVGSMRFVMPATVEVLLDEQKTGVSDRDRLARIREAVEEDLRWAFGLLRARPFEEEFLGCGFQLSPAEKGTTVVVLGYSEALAFRLADGRITAHLENGPDDDAWWEHKGRKQADGRWLLDSLVRRIDGETYSQKIAYDKMKGLQVPKGFERFVEDSAARGRARGVDEYDLKKLKAEPTG
ncbi:MAG: hypothetical protein ACT4PV_15645 [Planctomycetaceae bacterium]